MEEQEEEDGTEVDAEETLAHTLRQLLVSFQTLDSTALLLLT